MLITDFEMPFTTQHDPVASDIDALSRFSATTINQLVLPEGFDTLPRSEQFMIVRDQIGHTPLLPVSEVGEESIYQKIEFYNPSGSHYDRAYAPTIEHLETTGLIRPGDELRDISSGSAGIALALYGKIFGYRVRITVPDELPLARIEPMRILGAELVSAGLGYIKSASDFQAKEIKDLMRSGWKRLKPNDSVTKAIVLTKDDERICYINHSENALTPFCFQTIGHELVQQCAAIQTIPSAVILAIGNWTTIAGISPAVKDAWPTTKIIGFIGANHDTYGTTVDGIPLRFKDEGLLDDIVVVTDEERNYMETRINSAREQAMRLGRSSLVGLVVAEKIQQEHPGTIMTIAYDQRYRY